MARKIPLFFFLFLILGSFLLVFTQASGHDGLVGVRIFASEKAVVTSAQTADGAIIDYGSFLWTVLSPQDLKALDDSGMTYQTVENPYMLTLGGQTFDPLMTTPLFSADWEGNTQKSGPGLHLVQFQGPTKTDWLDSLALDGLDVLQYIHPFTYVVWGEPASLSRSSGNPFVRWTGDFLPAYAVQPQNRTLDSKPLAVRIMIYPGAGLDDTLQAIEKLGGTLIASATGKDPVFDLATLTLPGDMLSTAAALPGVYAIQPIPTEGGDRGEMSNQINAGNYDGFNRAFPGYRSWLNQLGLSGQGVVIANVDSGVDQAHPDLINRLLGCTGSTCGNEIASGHGTHTAGIMVGDGTSGITDGYGFLRGLGMAPGANLVEQVYSPTYTQPGGMLTLMTQSTQNSAFISGNSWGPSVLPLGYDADTRLVDIGVRDADPVAPGNQPLSFVLSIMNGYGGTSTQGTPDEAKNAFTIGSTEMQTAAGAQKLNINDLSPVTAHGPALDGRNIPHLVAPGYDVDSVFSDGSFGIMGGTSMASPHVTGAVALFVEKYRETFALDPSPALVKAAFLPVAHDLAGNHDADGGLLGHPFDAKQGWGRLNAETVLDYRGSAVYIDQPTLLNDTGDSWSMDITFTQPIEELRAMLVWTDAPGHGLGGSTPAWVNNLDLTLSINGHTYRGNTFGVDGFSVVDGTPDAINNTEGIFLSAAGAGTCTFTVTAANLAGDGVPNMDDSTDQDFALVVYFASEQPHINYFLPLFFR